MERGRPALRSVVDTDTTAGDGAPADASVDAPDDATLREMLHEMLRARAVSTKLVSLQRQGRYGVFAAIDGQEASAVGSVFALDAARDWIVPAYREAPALKRFPAERMLPVSIALASQIPHAVGLAWGLQLKGSTACVLVYFGDGATSEGDFYEAGNHAGVLKAPLVLFCVNNGWAISTPVAKQTAAATIADKAAAFGMPGVRVDGNDVLAVYAETARAVARARRGDGPTLIEAVTYRYSGHTTADDPTRYVPAEEVAAWRTRDPIARFTAYLQARGLYDESLHQRAEEAADDDVRSLLDEVAGRARSPEQLFDHVHRDDGGDVRLRRQRQAAVGRAGPPPEA